MALAIGFKAAAMGVLTTGLAAFLQIAAGGEDLTVALEHSAGAGAFATVAVYLVLKGRVDGHSQDIKEIKSALGAQDVVLSEMNRDIGELVGEARARRYGRVRTRSDDSDGG